MRNMCEMRPQNSMSVSKLIGIRAISVVDARLPGFLTCVQLYSMFIVVFAVKFLSSIHFFVANLMYAIFL